MTRTSEEDMRVVFDTIRLAAILDDHRIRLGEDWQDDTASDALSLAEKLRRDAQNIAGRYSETA